MLLETQFFWEIDKKEIDLKDLEKIEKPIREIAESWTRINVFKKSKLSERARKKYIEIENMRVNILYVKALKNRLPAFERRYTKL